MRLLLIDRRPKPYLQFIDKSTIVEHLLQSKEVINKDNTRKTILIVKKLMSNFKSSTASIIF